MSAQLAWQTGLGGQFIILERLFHVEPEFTLEKFLMKMDAKKESGEYKMTDEAAKSARQKKAA